MAHFPFVIGLTGGIACGKSTVANLFKQLGADIIDADDITRELTAINQPAYYKIIEHFGLAVVNTDKTLNRKKLRELIFANTEEKTWLEKLLHPLVWQQMHNMIQHSNSPYVISVVPLLFETKIPAWIKRVVVVTATEKTQIQRVMERDQITRELAEAILKTQMKSEEKCKQADYIIDNNDDEANLKMQVLNLHRLFLKLAGENTF